MDRDTFRAEAIRRLTEIDQSKDRHNIPDYTVYETYQLQQLLAADGITTSRTGASWAFEGDADPDIIPAVETMGQRDGRYGLKPFVVDGPYAETYEAAYKAARREEGHDGK